MAIIGLLIRPGVKKGLLAADELISWAKKHEHEILLEEVSEAHGIGIIDRHDDRRITLAELLD